VALLIVVSIAAGASAQVDTGEEAGADTLVTPVAKETISWIQVAGAEHGIDKFPPSSPTPVEVELYTVAFRNDTHGFAGGARCKVAPGPGVTGDALAAELATCDREPVIYEYLKTETEESWRPVLPPEGDGFVGSIAFMRDGTALAVGGTDDYPKREGGDPTTVDNDPAGRARAWLYEDGFWTEIEDDRMRDGMRGLTAVAMSPDVGDCTDDNVECGLAGGYRQMWLWKDGRFVDGWDSAPIEQRSPDAQRTVRATATTADDATDDDSDSFRFRVRQIAFVDHSLTKAFAVTSGCCDELAAREVPAGLVFDGEQLYAKEAGAQTNVVGQDPSPRLDVVDSLYGVVVGRAGMAVIATPGGPADADPERPSRVYTAVSIPAPDGTFQPMPNAAEAVKHQLSTMRLTSGAGASSGRWLDWSVGSLANDQGIAYVPDDDRGTTAAFDVTVLSCPGGGWGSLATISGPPDLQCEPYDVPQGYLGQAEGKGFFRLPSYGLNAVAFTDDTQSVGWAVGDRGAIVRVGGIGTTAAAASEPTPAKLGAGTIARLEGSDVYDQFRPLPTDGDTAPVPSLVSNGTQELERPELVPGGAPNPTIKADASYPPEDVASVVMSRDGSEGWAVGTGWSRLTQLLLPQANPAPTLYHYDGVRWSRCDITGVPGLLPADPACSGLGELFGNGLGPDNVILRYAVRVPLENDGDPSNDDEFEVFAIGNHHRGTTGQTPMRYRDGRWSVDEASLEAFSDFDLLEVRSVAFSAPDDGWVVSHEGGSLALKHWDGQEWVDCDAVEDRHDMEKCGDPADRLPLGSVTNGTLNVAGTRVYLASSRSSAGSEYPVILYKDPGGSWKSTGGGYDPACAEDGDGRCVEQQGQPDQHGFVRSMAISPDFRHGWAIGQFGTSASGAGSTPDEALGSQYYLLRLSGGVWTPYREDDASLDYLAGGQAERAPRPVMLDAASGTAAIHSLDVSPAGPPVLIFEPTRGETGRWRVLETPFHSSGVNEFESSGLIRAFAPDGAGGAWLVARQARSNRPERVGVHFWHYTREAPNAVFEEAPHPVRESITGGAAGSDGSFWVTTNSGFVYRYDRLTGWDRLRVPGWDPGRVVTRTSEANAVAVGPDGEGVVVGKNGRIAQVSPAGVRLDPAAGETCGEPPCGTGRDLRAVDVAPGGSALAGGDASVLLYRPPGGEFRRIDFGGSANTSITAISMPTDDRAWVTTAAGQVYAGRRDGDDWSFFVENRGPGGDLLSRDEKRALLRLHGIEIDKDGEGYAVGARGLLLERRGDGGWQRLKTGFLDTFRSVTLAPNGRDQGAMIGGDMGLVLTLEDGEFRAAREADLFSPVNYGARGESASVVGVAMVPGVENGDVEAWAVQQAAGGPGVVLHYASDPDQPLMRPGGRVEPLPDAPEARPGEISFAAFGRSECHQALSDMCAEGYAGNLFHEVVARRVAKAVIDESKEAGGPAFAVFTGEVGRAAGGELTGGTAGTVNTPLDKSRVHRRWRELVASRFADAGLPLFGAVGRNDLDRTAACLGTTCAVDANAQAGTGLTWGWRKAMAEMPSPWGSGDGSPSTDRFHFKEVADADGVEEDRVVGGARTHYAVDLERPDQRKAARLIVLDNSMRTLQSSDPNQNPLEPRGGQLTWLDRMLTGVDEERGQQAIVVMNTPTYSYKAGDPSAWAGDAPVLESRFVQHDVKMVVSGRLGWNGRFWATSAGVHHPCPDGAYVHDDDAPEPDSAPCEDDTAAVNDPANRAGAELADVLQGLNAPAPPGEDDVTALTGEEPDSGLQGVVPMVVAASAGGRFGPNGNEGGVAADGWWHGYTVVRMDESGDPRKTIVEQRPIFDWISITAATHVLKPRQRMTLRGEGREPVGVDVAPRYDAINSNAITHRYDLVLADEQNPSMPRKANGRYVEVPASVGRIDGETGVVTAGSGRQERTYTVAILSVGDKTASWPIAFEPAKSFKARVIAAPVRSVINPPARPPQVRPPAPPPVVLNQPPAPTPPGTPPPPVPPINVPPINLPPPPQLPNLPSLPTGTPTPAPPPPAAPPAPPGNQGALPLSLQAPLAPISVVTTVIPPSPPPVNPAPPGGSAARKEARQRQAATAKSEEGGGGEQGAGESSGGESGSAELTRRDRTRPAPSYDVSRRDDQRYSFTARSETDQASAWSSGALYGGMTIVTALALAMGWNTARPTPKRRYPPRPVPQTVRDVGRRPRN
jgi:hypothetical protein